jgi:hypothetical protein
MHIVSKTQSARFVILERLERLLLAPMMYLAAYAAEQALKRTLTRTPPPTDQPTAGLKAEHDHG